MNKTASAMRLTHNATGLEVCCQDEKSQHKNLSKALRVLKSRLYELKRDGGAEETLRPNAARRSARATATSASAPTTFPQNRLTDHRINQNFQSGKRDRRQLDASGRCPDRMRPPAQRRRSGISIEQSSVFSVQFSVLNTEN